MGIPCEVVTWNRFYALARKLAQRVRASGYRPDVIVAIARGGLIPARVLSDLLEQPDLTSFRIEHYRASQRQAQARVRDPLTADLAGRRVLLVDDVTESGDTFVVALEHLRSRGEPAEVRTATLHHKTISPCVPDYYAQKVVKWRWIGYPWAVAEDLGHFIRAMSPRPDSPDEVARRLAADHGIRVPRRLLVEVLALLEAG